VQGAAVAIVLGYVAMAVVLIWYLRKEHRRVRGR
jgi:Na+-driven multidrug efflux pump